MEKVNYAIVVTIYSVINNSAYRASEQSRPRRDPPKADRYAKL